MNVGGVLRGRVALARHALAGGRAGVARRGRASLFVLVLLGVMTALSWFGFRTVFATLVAAGASSAALATALGLVLTSALVSMLLSDLDGAVGTLLLDRDLELLRRAPVRPRALVALKLLDALPRTFGPLLVIALPALAVFARLPGQPAFAVLLVPPALLLLWAVSLATGVAAASPLLALLPARRARELLAFLSTLAFTVVWIANVLFVPRLGDLGERPLEAALAFLERARGAIAWSPGAWTANGFAALGRGDVAAAAACGAALLAATALAMALALRAAGRLTRALDALSARGDRRTAPSVPSAPPGAGPAGLVRATLARDRRLFTREWTVLGDVVVATLLWTLLPLASGALLVARGGELARIMLVTLAVGLGYEIAARSIPFERAGLTWSRLAPVRPGRWLAAKLASATLLAGGLLLTVSVVLAFAGRLGVQGWLESLGGAIPALALSTLLGLWAGAAFGDLRWTNPRRMLTLAGRLTASGLMLAQVTSWLLVELGSGARGLGLPLRPIALAAAAGIGFVAWFGTLRVLVRGRRG